MGNQTVQSVQSVQARFGTRGQPNQPNQVDLHLRTNNTIINKHDQHDETTVCMSDLETLLEVLPARLALQISTAMERLATQAGLDNHGVFVNNFLALLDDCILAWQHNLSDCAIDEIQRWRALHQDHVYQTCQTKFLFSVNVKIKHHHTGKTGKKDKTGMTGMTGKTGKTGKNGKKLKHNLPTSLQVWTGQFAHMDVDLLVNPTNLGKSGCYNAAHCCIDSQVHRAAGPKLRRACRQMSSQPNHDHDCHDHLCQSWFVTPGFDLPAKHILHVVEPRLFVNRLGQLVQTDQLLRLKACYQTGLQVCDQYRLRSLAFSCMAVMPDLPEFDLHGLHGLHGSYGSNSSDGSDGSYDHTDNAVYLACQTACQSVASYVMTHSTSIEQVVFCVPLQHSQLYFAQFQRILHNMHNMQHMQHMQHMHNMHNMHNMPVMTVALR